MTPLEALWDADVNTAGYIVEAAAGDGWTVSAREHVEMLARASFTPAPKTQEILDVLRNAQFTFRPVWFPTAGEVMQGKALQAVEVSG
ncbi:hypothetical protein [Cellulomonas iranensis]|uniref:Uncharacterized protein n=1 Tax=Cellulomonas iranensis TaxID=76862 RepID=A0ABU0GGS4_9CELL|nr:hypothetical protein [Cellulomonas iranensis]MDQ0424562.1 hypothetical protein [Cellulomonas iranensis]